MTSELEMNPEAGRQMPEDAPVRRPEHRESSLTRLIEQQTAKFPSDVFLVVALAAMATSLILEVAGRERASRFIGMWPGPMLVMGVYNKLVKLMGAT